jgi:Zn finger protein HypA/HybF involved in hydrogenase expression
MSELIHDDEEALYKCSECKGETFYILKYDRVQCANCRTTYDTTVEF